MPALDWKDVVLGGMVIALCGLLVVTGHQDGIALAFTSLGMFVNLLLTPKKSP